MKWLQNVLLGVAAFLLVHSCATSGRVGLTSYTGFTELPFPSNNYTSGQIVEVLSSPRKVEITMDPRIPWDQTTVSDGWNISASDSKKVEASLKASISSILQANAAITNNEQVTVSFSNVKTRIVEKIVIYEALEKKMKESEALRRMMAKYIANGTNYDVITQTISAKVAFKLTSGTGASVKLDPIVIQQLNATMGTNFNYNAEENVIISGEELVVGFHYDPTMIDLLLDQ